MTSTAKTSLTELIFGFILSIPLNLFGGFILSKMWAWFITPKFGLPSIGVIDAIGITTLVNFILIGIIFELDCLVQKETQETSTLIKILVKGLFIYPLCLLFAYIWSCFL